MRCAVGLLIPDEEYKTTYEEKALEEVIADAPYLQVYTEGFLYELQRCHDRSVMEGYTPQKMEAKLRLFVTEQGEKFNIKVPNDNS